MRHNLASIGKRSACLGVVAMLICIGYFYYSLTTGEERVSALFNQMKPGMPVIELTTLAKRHGLGPGTPKPEAKLIFLAETRSFGRHSCRVKLENGVVTSATYYLAD